MFLILAGGFALILAVAAIVHRLEKPSTTFANRIAVVGGEVIQRDGRKSTVELAVRNEGTNSTSGTLSFLLDLEVLREGNESEAAGAACLDRMVKNLCEDLDSLNEQMTEPTTVSLTSGAGCAHQNEVPSTVCRLEGKAHISLKRGETRLLRLNADIPEQAKLGGGIAKQVNFLPD